jgi:hypothetical protein
VRGKVRVFLIELRPWPFGPPLRGRATLDEKHTKKYTIKVSNGNQDLTPEIH